MAIEEIVNPSGAEEPLLSAGRRFKAWVDLVTQLDIQSGTGSPEGVVDAKQKTLYMDEAGTAGSILYIKRDADIVGDRKSGWILV